MHTVAATGTEAPTHEGRAGRLRAPGRQQAADAARAAALAAFLGRSPPHRWGARTRGPGPGPRAWERQGGALPPPSLGGAGSWKQASGLSGRSAASGSRPGAQPAPWTPSRPPKGRRRPVGRPAGQGASRTARTCCRRRRRRTSPARRRPPGASRTGCCKPSTSWSRSLRTGSLSSSACG